MMVFVEVLLALIISNRYWEFLGRIDSKKETDGRLIV
jgi:hypothetical protein